MGHPTSLQHNHDRSAEPKVASGVGWSEFFHELGEGTRGAQGGLHEEAPGAVQERALYASENGDRWSLVREMHSGRVFVRHRPNLASGGRSGDMDVGAFLVRGGMGPEKQELLRLIGSAVGGPEVST